MKLLSCTPHSYYGSHRAIEPQHYYLFKVPQTMGIEVDFFDFIGYFALGPELMRRMFLSLLKGGNYDAVFLAVHRDEFDLETLTEARRYAPIFAWNSDDEWRWDDYSSGRVDWYTWMVTNSPTIYSQFKPVHPNLLHAQWACTGFWNGLETPKDIDFSFAGQVYGARKAQIDDLKRSAGLEAYGKGTDELWMDSPRRNAWRARMGRQARSAILRKLFPWIYDEMSTINFDLVNSIWNRTRVSFTPLDSSQKNVLQIKSRVFDMGLSGTLMLAPQGAGLEQYYEDGKEYVSFADLRDCAEKAKFYLANEPARRKIASAYAARTQAEHLWSNRIKKVLVDADLWQS